MSRPYNCRDDSPRWFDRYPHPDLARYIEREGSERTFRSLGWPSWGLLYHLAVAYAIPDEDNAIVEVGTNLGMSTIVLAQALVDFGILGRVDTFESDFEFAEEAKRRIKDAGLSDRVVVHAESFEKMTTLPESISFAFIDFTKNRELNEIAFQRCYANLRPGGAMLFDNSETVGVSSVLCDAANRGHAIIHMPHVSWGFWPPPQADRGGTPGMALVQKPRGF